MAEETDEVPTANEEIESVENSVARLKAHAGRKEIRGLSLLMTQIVNTKNYEWPATNEERSEFLKNRPSLDIFEPSFLKKKKSHLLSEFTERALRIPGLSMEVSRESLWDRLTTLVLEELGLRVSKEGKQRTADELIQTLFVQILGNIERHRFNFVVNGARLESGRISVDFGPFHFFTFNENTIENIWGPCDTGKGNQDRFARSHKQYMLDHHMGRSGISIPVSGDENQALKNAKTTASRCIAGLRFACCLFYSHAANPDRFRIYIPGSIKGRDPWITDSVARTVGVSRVCSSPIREIQKFVLNDEVINLMKINHFDDLFGLFFEPYLNELDASIVRATEWIGDALEDTSLGAAFTKYWISLETLFSTGKENVGERLRRAITMVLIYAWGDLSESKRLETMRHIGRLYDLRCSSVHRGMREISPDDLTAIREFSTAALISFLRLRKMDYQNHSAINAEIDRLFFNCLDFFAIHGARTVHKPNCRHIAGRKSIEKPLEEFDSLEHARENGFRPCITCIAE